MGKAKDDVRRMLDQMPENASYEEIEYHIHVRRKIARGLEDVEAGRVLSDVEVEERMKRWTEPSGGPR